MTVRPLTYASITPTGNMQYAAEASCLGLRPGDWPDTLPVADNMGNGLPFIRNRNPRLCADGEMIGYRYVQAQGVLTLFVSND